MDIYSYYEDAIDEVFEKSPSMILESYLGKNTRVSSIELMKLIISLEKKWKDYRNFNVQFGIIIDENIESENSSKIFDYDFNNDIEEIIKDGMVKSKVFIIDKNGGIIAKKNKQDKISFVRMRFDSEKTNSIAFFLGVNGIDVSIRGKVYTTKNHLDSYRDLIYSKFYSICEYKEMLQKFFLDEVQYDLKGRYFAQKKYYPKNVHCILDKHPKLLHSKPEIDFQKDLEHFLKENCNENVLTEVHNKSNDRYDVWVSTDDNDLYVFEIKWLGKSITPEGNIFEAYNKEERAIDGAYQIKDYVDNANKYSHIFADAKIYCGVLIIFDARDEMSDITYPCEFEKYPQIDLSQHFKICRSKISASSAYKKSIKKA